LLQVQQLSTLDNRVPFDPIDIVPYDSDKIAKQIDKLINEYEENDNRENIEEYSLDVISTKIFEVYKKVVEEI